MTNNAEICRWTGVSGWGYDYVAFPMGTPLLDLPGNYALCGITPEGYWKPLYFGEAEDLKRRCCVSHEKWEAAIRLGACSIHVHFNGAGRRARLTEEADLRRAFKPPLNEQ